MRVIKRNVYYCDFCKTTKLTRHAMDLHEKHCTNNPKRKCRCCDYLFRVRQKSLSEMLKWAINKKQELEQEFYLQFFGAETFNIAKEKALKELNELTLCPTCKLAVLRQSGLRLDFDYKREMQVFYDNVINK